MARQDTVERETPKSLTLRWFTRKGTIVIFPPTTRGGSCRAKEKVLAASRLEKVDSTIKVKFYRIEPKKTQIFHHLE